MKDQVIVFFVRICLNKCNVWIVPGSGICDSFKILFEAKINLQHIATLSIYVILIAKYQTAIFFKRNAHKYIWNFRLNCELFKKEYH